MALDALQRLRYARQLVMPEFPEPVMDRLFACGALVHGTGLSMEICTLYMAAAGVGGVVLTSSVAETERVLSQLRAINPECMAGVSEKLPDSVTAAVEIDFAGGTGAGTVERALQAVAAGRVYLLVLRSGGVSVVMNVRRQGACPACVLGAVNPYAAPCCADASGQWSRIAHSCAVVSDDGIAGAVAASIAIGELAGYAAAPREALLLDPVSGRYTGIESGPTPGCPYCLLLG
ncbi:MAG: hypothetical protein WC889_07375 [Myxococcota bacterium]|jgi:hypothetical protein